MYSNVLKCHTHLRRIWYNSRCHTQTNLRCNISIHFDFICITKESHLAPWNTYTFWPNSCHPEVLRCRRARACAPPSRRGILHRVAIHRGVSSRGQSAYLYPMSRARPRVFVMLGSKRDRRPDSLAMQRTNSVNLAPDPSPTSLVPPRVLPSSLCKSAKAPWARCRSTFFSAKRF